MTCQVVLVAGFGVPTRSLSRLADRLRSTGASVHVAPTGLNVDCGERTAVRIAALVDDLPAPVTLVGHSRGGQLTRVVAVRRPGTVDVLVTAGTPWSIGPPDRPGVAMMARALRAGRRVGIDLLPSIDCATGECCTAFRADLAGTPAARWVALWSSADRVAGEDSRPPAIATTVVDTGTSHLGFVRDRAGIDAVVAAVDGD